MTPLRGGLWSLSICEIHVPIACRADDGHSRLDRLQILDTVERAGLASFTFERVHDISLNRMP
jgi:hypothetical protein